MFISPFSYNLSIYLVIYLFIECLSIYFSDAYLFISRMPIYLFLECLSIFLSNAYLFISRMLLYLFIECLSIYLFNVVKDFYKINDWWTCQPIHLIKQWKHIIKDGKSSSISDLHISSVLVVIKEALNAISRDLKGSIKPFDCSMLSDIFSLIYKTRSTEEHNCFLDIRHKYKILWRYTYSPITFHVLYYFSPSNKTSRKKNSVS